MFAKRQRDPELNSVDYKDGRSSTCKKCHCDVVNLVYQLDKKINIFCRISVLADIWREQFYTSQEVFSTLQPIT